MNNLEELKKAALEALGDECTVNMIGADLFHVSTIDGDGIADCDNQKQAEFIASASPAVTLALIAQLEAAQFEIKELNNKLETPVSLPKAAYFKNSAENLPFFRAFAVIEAIHKAGFATVTYED